MRTNVRKSSIMWWTVSFQAKTKFLKLIVPTVVSCPHVFVPLRVRTSWHKKTANAIHDVVHLNAQCLCTELLSNEQSAPLISQIKQKVPECIMLQHSIASKSKSILWFPFDTTGVHMRRSYKKNKTSHSWTTLKHLPQNVDCFFRTELKNLGEEWGSLWIYKHS